MISADALIQALQRRLLVLAPHRRRPPGEFPPGWQQWFDAMRARPGRVTGAPADALVATLLQRPLATPPRRVGELTRWEAFTTLWRQQWDRPEPQDRGLRWLAGGITATWHLLLAAMLVWLMYLDLINAAHPPPKGEELVVQIEYIGEGTPEDVGGGPDAEPVPQPVQPAAQPAPSEAQAATAVQQPSPAPPEATTEALPVPPAFEVQPIDMSQPVVPLPSTAVAEREVPLAEPEPAAQPLAVSEPVPDVSETFVLPPPTRIEAPPVAMPELEATVPEMQVVEIPREVRAPTVQRLPTPTVAQPVLQATVPEVAVRELPVPLRRPAAPVIRTEPAEVPRIRAPVASVRERRIEVEPREAPTPTPAAPAPAPARDGAPAEATAAAEATPAPETPDTSGTPATPAASPSSKPKPQAMAGPRPTPSPGGWPSPQRADDWGASDTERPGAQRGEPPGLYNSDGSVRLAESPGSASPGQAPGTITEEIADLDRAGTWLRRPPNDYEPTAFDEYWRPNETLLQEWVRKSVTTIRIPIPGTTKYIECTTVMLVMGGACGIGDPNLNEQPATARPPPDIPFKPELQEGNGSRPPASGG